MTEIFFLAYQFPPINVGGAFRPLKFVKFFNSYGIKPIIFTLASDDYPKVYLNKKPDFELLDDINKVEKEIVQVRTEELLSKRRNKIQAFVQIYFNLTKGIEHKKWGDNFFESTKKALKKYSPKAILVTAPPFGMVELAVKLSKETGIPLVIDMRDSLSMWVSQPYGSYLHYKLTLKKEREWFQHAEKVIAVTQQMVSDWKNVHKGIDQSKYNVIPNGYDKEVQFSEIKIKSNKEKFIIGYVGSFYYNPDSRRLMFTPWQKKRLHRKLQFTPRKEDWLYRSPYFFFKTVNLLLNTHPELKSKILIRFAGAKPDWLDSMVIKFNLQENIEHLGFMNFAEIEEFQLNCDALLVTSVKVLDGEDYCIAGKTFDYITMNKPIFGFVTEGSQKQFIENSKTGIIFDPDDTEGSAGKIMDILDNGIKLSPDEKFIEKFHRKQLTKQLSDIIFSVIK